MDLQLLLPLALRPTDPPTVNLDSPTTLHHSPLTTHPPPYTKQQHKHSLKHPTIFSSSNSAYDQTCLLFHDLRSESSKAYRCSHTYRPLSDRHRNSILLQRRSKITPPLGREHKAIMSLAQPGPAGSFSCLYPSDLCGSTARCALVTPPDLRFKFALAYHFGRRIVSTPR